LQKSSKPASLLLFYFKLFFDIISALDIILIRSLEIFLNGNYSLWRGIFRHGNNIDIEASTSGIPSNNTFTLLGGV